MGQKRRVAVGDVKPGMYVVELDRPWDQVPFEAPFELQGFFVESPFERERVGEFCNYVYIDPQFGIGADSYLDDDDVATVKAKPVEANQSLFELESEILVPVYHDQLTVEEEIARTREILKDTHAVYADVIGDLKAGRTIDTAAVKETVGSLVNSVIRNPDAASLLIKLKRADDYTYLHAMAVCVNGLAMGRYVGLPESELNFLGAALLLQDVGKIKLPQSLLMKTRKLSDQDRRLLQIHVDASVIMLRENSGLDPASIGIIRSHHERHNGLGYPRGRKEAGIPITASVSGIVDSYVAMISERPYRTSKTSFQALMALYSERDNLFPAAVVENFIRCIGVFPVGSFVELSSGEVGVVISRNNFAQLKPHVMLVLDKKGKRLKEPKTVDLYKQDTNDDGEKWNISRVVDPSEYKLNPDDFFV